MKNDLVPYLFSLLPDPLTAGIIDQCPGGRDRNDTQGNESRGLFFMLVYAHGSEYGILE
jgi:hypothetical protein